MSRRQWVALAIVLALLAALVVGLVLSRTGAETEGPAAGPSASPSPSATTSGPGSPSPSGSESATPVGSPSVSGSPAEDGLPQVTIDTPTPGEHSGIPVHATGTAVAFEGVARFEVLQGGRVFTDGPLYADRGAPERGSWETDIELPIGEYTLVVFLESPKDGHRIAETRVRFFAG